MFSCPCTMFFHKTYILHTKICSELLQEVHGTRSCSIMINTKMRSETLKKGGKSWIWKGKKFLLLQKSVFLVSITFLLLQFSHDCSWTSHNLPILKAEGKVAGCSETGNLPPPSSAIPHKNIRSKIKTEWLESSKITSLPPVCLQVKTAFNSLKM